MRVFAFLERFLRSMAELASDDSLNVLYVGQLTSRAIFKFCSEVCGIIHRIDTLLARGFRHRSTVDGT